MTPALEQVIGRAVIDKTFRDELFINVENAISSSGISLTPEELTILKQGIEKLKSQITSSTVDEQLGKVSVGTW